MISSLISILVVALILALLYWAVSRFVSGTPLTIVGVILGLVLLLYALQKLNLLHSIDL